MPQLKDLIKSGSKFPGDNNSVERIVIGLPGTPDELIIYQGKIYIYNTADQTLIDGGYITTRAIESLIITVDKLNINAQHYINNIGFVATGEDSCNWAAGNIIFSDGTQIPINSGSATSLSAINYIYYNGSSTLQKTTSLSSAIGGNNIPIAIIEPVSTGDGKCVITPFISNGTTISGDNIYTGKIKSTSEKTYFDLDKNVLNINDDNDDRIIIGKMQDGSYGVKISLPGYDASTDTDLDHFALWSTSNDDEDNILIKELLRGSANFAGSSYPSGYQITHSLGYVPFFLAFVKDTAGAIGTAGEWYQIGNGNLSIAYAAFADTTKLYLFNEASGSTTFIWYIFYDNVVGSSGHTITESDYAFKISKVSVDADTSEDPNDFIFHSDLNTFKIIKEGVFNFSAGNGTTVLQHNANIANPAAFVYFCKFWDGSITMGNGTFPCVDRDNNTVSVQASINQSQITFKTFTGGSTLDFSIKYYIFETPLI